MNKFIAHSLVASMVCAFVCTPASAVPINYFDFVGTNVTYKNVTEDSATDPTPLWGAPPSPAMDCSSPRWLPSRRPPVGAAPTSPMASSTPRLW